MSPRATSQSLSSRRHPLVQEVRRLQQDARFRRKTQRFVVEGVRLAEEVLRAGLRPLQVFWSPTMLSPRGFAVVDAFIRQDVPVREATPHVMEAMSATETPQGLLLVMPWVELPWPQPLTWLVLVDGLQDPGNLGTLLRTSWAAGVQAVALLPGTVDPWSPKVVRAAMGAHFHLPLRRLSWDQWRAMREGFHLYVAAAHEGQPYTQVPWRFPLALAIGSEAHGVREPLYHQAHQKVTIPLAPGVESLNAAVAAGVLLFEIRRHYAASRSQTQTRERV